MRATSDPAMAMNIQRAKMQQSAASADQLEKTRERIGKASLAIAQLPDGPQREQAWSRVLAMHPDASSLAPSYRDYRTGPSAVAAEYGQSRDQLGDDVKRAQINMTNAHAQYYRSAADARAAGPQAPQKRMGIDKSGRMIDVDSEDFINATYTSGAALEDAFDAAQGATASSGQDLSNPHRFVDGKGIKQWQFANNAQKDAVEKLKADAIKRFEREAEIQARGNGLYGKAPIGQKYTAEGGLVPLPGSKSNQSEETLQKLVSLSEIGIDRAAKVLTNQTLIERTTGKALDYGETGQAYKDIKLSISGLVYALSGKQTTKYELQNFEDKFMPNSLDSADRINVKISRIKEFIGALKKAKTKGIFEPDEMMIDAGLEVERLRAEREKTEREKATAPRGESAPDPNKARLINKYGLEK